MKPTPFNKKYICPICGKKAIVGEHFCIVPKNRDYSDDGKAAVERIKRVLAPIVAFILIVCFLWGYVKYYSLYVLILAPVAFAAIRIGGTIGKRNESRDYEELRLLVGGDARMADRLVDAEMARSIRPKRADCVKTALEKLRRDKSR